MPGWSTSLARFRRPLAPPRIRPSATSTGQRRHSWQGAHYAPRRIPSTASRRCCGRPPGFASAAFVSTPRNARFYRLGETIAVEWTFTEPVTVRGVPTLALTMRGPADTLGAGVRPMRYISGSGTATLRFEYTVQQGDFTSNETEPLGIQAAAGASPFTLDGAVIRAVADNAEADLVPSADTDFLETSDANHKVETRPVPVMGASVSSSPASGTTYGAGETMTVSLAMREAVRVTGRPYIWLDVGGAQRRANYAGPIGESTAALEFSYTVQAGDRDADGVALCASGPGCGAIQLNGGSIRGVADGLDANLALPQMAAQSGHKVDGMPPSIPTACTDEISVPHDWALKPSGVAAGAKFRLLFVTSTSRTASSTNIADYNRFVQGRAATGHADIRPYSKGVRVLGSTQAVNARVNTCTRSSSTDAAVYWLNGAKVADNYTGLYDGSWDSGADRRESGAELTGDARIWTGTNNNGTTADFLGKSGSGGRDVTFGRSNQVDSPLESGLGTRTNNFRIYGLSQIFVAKATRTAPSATAISITSSPVIGDTYLLGETIEFEVTYSEAVDVRGTPRIGLAVSTHDRSFLVEFEAAYVRGSGTNKLVFAWDVSDRAQDSNGIQTFPNTLRLNGATITAMSDGFPAVWSIPAWRNIGGKVDGTQTVSTDGVCGRTKEVRDVIVGKVSAASDCSQVTDAHLAAITGSSASFRVGGLTSLKLGDFAGLSGVGQLILSGSGIETLPVGLFDGLDSLLTLTVVTGLTHLPKDIFRGLGDILIWLNLSGEGTGGTSRNSLAAGSLPDGVFEPLTKLETLTLTGNPGFDTFKPAADAGPGGTLTAGETVMLGGPGTSGGPWGSNVTHAWTQTDGDDMAASTVTLSATDVAKPGFTVPVLVSETDVKLGLTVTGRGGGTDLASPTSTAEFTIRALAPTALAVISKPIADSTYKQGETIEIAVTFGDRVLVDTSLGTPGLTLSVGVAGPRASYVRGSGTNRLVFAYTIGDGVGTIQTDTDGISVLANALALNGGVIASLFGAAAILDHDAVAAQSGHKVDGSTAALTGGVCGRTAQVRDKLVDLVKANDAAVTDCSQVTDAHLGALTGTLNLRGGPGGTLRRRPHDRPQGGRLRRSHGHHVALAEQQPSARHPGRGVRPADGADEFEPQQ